MKKLTVLLIALLLFLCACSVHTKYEYVTASHRVELFSCFEQYGGVVESAEFTMNYEVYLTVKFKKAEDINSAIKAINVLALNEKQYDENKRVMELKGKSDKTAIIYVRNVNALRDPLTDFSSGKYFKENLAENYATTEFARVNGDKFAIENIADKNVVLRLGDIPPNTQIKFNGSGVVSSTVLGRESVAATSLLYSITDAVVVIEKSYTVLIVVLAVSVLFVLVIVFMVLVNIQVFTKLKMKKIKSGGDN